MGLFGRKKKSDIEQIWIGVVPLPVSFEGRHIALSGSTGTGKTVALRRIVSTIRARGDAALIVDAGGELMSEFRRPGDTILNPFDARSVRWDPIHEMQHHAADAPRLAMSLVPPAGGGSAESWAGYSRALLEVLLPLAADVGELTELLFLRPTYPPEPDKNGMVAPHEPALSELCAGSSAGRLFAPGSAHYLSNILSELGSHLGWLRHASRCSGAAWSARKWVQSIDENPSVVWMPIRADQRQALAPMAASVVTQSILQILSLAPSNTRRVWIICDEIGSYPAIPDFAQSLTQGRKFGLRVVIGLQSVAQVIRSYGIHGAQEILSCLGTVLALRPGDPDTAEWTSRLFGSREVIRKNKSKSDHGSSSSEQRRDERVLLPLQLSQLKDLYGYLKLPGDYQAAQIKLNILTRTDDVTSPFIPAKWLSSGAEPTQKQKAPAQETGLKLSIDLDAEAPQL